MVYYLDTGKACGGVKIEEGHVVECAPYFNALKDWPKRDVFFLITRSRHFFYGEESAEAKGLSQLPKTSGLCREN